MIDKADKAVSKFDFLFSVSSYIFKSHYRRKHFPSSDRKFRQWWENWVHYWSCWAIVLVLYTLSVYLFAIDTPDTFLTRVANLYRKPPAETISSVYSVLKDSFWLNAVVVYFLRKAVAAASELNFVLDYFVHQKLSGLIKVVKCASFNTSMLPEASEAQLGVARQNIDAIVNGRRRELVSVVTASGWDLFGVPREDASQDTNKTQAKPNTLFQSAKSWFSDEELDSVSKRVDHGFLLPSLAKREKTSQVLLLDPRSDFSRSRAKNYVLSGAETGIINERIYFDRCLYVLHRLREVQKANPNLSVRLTTQAIDWKIIIVDGAQTWIQHIAGDRGSDHSPLYGFRDGAYSLYNCFFNINERLWHSGQDLTDILLEKIEADLLISDGPVAITRGQISILKQRKEREPHDLPGVSH